MDGQYTEAHDIDSEINKQNENAIIIRLFQGCTRRNMKKIIYFQFIYSINVIKLWNGLF